MNPQASWTVVTLCRRSDPDRSPRFFQALDCLNASGQMGDLDDGPEQVPLDDLEVRNTILSLLVSKKFDLIITHSLQGEYTRHRRHEETSAAVSKLWQSGKLSASEMWQFAYEDGQAQYLPRPIEQADWINELPEKIWQKKYEIISKIYGFQTDSFEAKTAPRKEAFWCFRLDNKVKKRINNRS